MKRVESALIVFILISINLYGAIVIIIPQTARAEGSWENILSISKTVEVPPGEEYFAYFDRDSGTIVEMALPSLEAGLTQNAKDALNQVPNWLRDDLAKKFGELGDTNIDVGDFATPVFADMDADFDLDLSLGSQEGTIFYFENVGTQFRPIFTLNNEMFSFINEEWSTDKTKTALTIGDLDADGDNDLIIGFDLGQVYYFENIGTSSQAGWGPYELITGIEAGGGNSHPALADLDNDGDYDLAIGDADGYINFYDNVGSPESAEWQTDYRMFTGEEDDRPICFADMDDDGDFDLTVGDGDFATLNFYRNIGSPSQEIWAEDLTYYNGISPEYGTSPVIADLNGDDRLDLVVGGFSGRLYLYKNSGSASNANWLIWSSYQVAEGFNYYPKEVMLNYRAEYHQDRYAQLILDAGQIYKDEIGFTIAHMPNENLKTLSQNQTQLLVDNAELIYEIDQYLDYVEVIEKGDYTTTRYKFGEPGNTTYRELPRDIYYWNVVHPKITDENVFYIHPDDSDSNHPTDPSQGGRFWREYLFFHNDTAYPEDQSGAPDDDEDDYPVPGVSPPLLKDLLSGVESLFNGTTWHAPGGNYSMFQYTGEDNIRPFTYGEHAVIRVSNWVGKTLIINQQEVSDSERPLQPVRIAHHHNGNCGELQDLTTAAARTALIPAAGVLLLGEDHVWIEFYENGWHQWDNYWSDAGSVIDNFDNYWVGWGQRGGSGIWKISGDDDTWEVTDQYIPEDDLSYVTIRVLDNNGDPVDGARVLVISYWLKVNIEGYQVEIPFPCIWNFTDSNGETLFKLATQTKPGGNHNFTFRIISKVGSFESGKNELEHGQDYTFIYPLEGSAPNPELDTNSQSNPNPPDPDYRFGATYQVVSSYQTPRNLVTGNYHPLEIPPYRVPVLPSDDHQGNHVDSFLCDGEGFSNYMKGYNFDSYELSENSNTYSLGFDLPDTETWYFVISNRDSIETTKVVDLTLDLFYNVPPYHVKILDPQNGAQLNIGGIIPISGVVTNQSELDFLKASFDGGSNWNYIFPVDGYWTFYWDTSALSLGSYTIDVVATFQSSEDTDSIQIDLVDYEAPHVIIDTPDDHASFNIGQTVLISGTVTDNVLVSSLFLSCDDGATSIDILSSMSGHHWSYNWDTSGFDPGGYVITIKASDGSNFGFASCYVELEDSSPPSISISSPTEYLQINVGSIVTIFGEAQDNRGIFSLLLSTDSGEHSTDILSTLNGTTWSYEWDTKGLPVGMRTLIVNASDGTYNVSDSVEVEMIDSQGPVISFTYPSEDLKINIGSQITISGTATDNVEISELKLKTGMGNWINIHTYLIGEFWSYEWDTSGCLLGSCIISIKASDGDLEELQSLEIELVDSEPPTLGISEPPQDKEFTCGETIKITGWVSDNTEVTDLRISMDSRDTWVDLTPNLKEGNWVYLWDTSEFDAGLYTISVEASDGINLPVYEEVQINLVDILAPSLEITSPQVKYKFDLGDMVLIEGKVTDDVGISSISISTDNGITWIDLASSLDNRGRWSYIWDTSELKSGSYSVRILASDGTNEVEESIIIELVDKETEEEGIFTFSMLILLVIVFVIIVLIVVGTIGIIRQNKKK